MPRDDAKPLPKLTQEQIARFHMYLADRPLNACWEWQGPRSDRNYGQITFAYKNYKAHRIAWLVFSGFDPAPLLILHKCDNPPCCNPAHLYQGTLKDNQVDASQRFRLPFGERNKSAKLTSAQVTMLRSLRKSGTSVAALAKQFGIHFSTVYRITARHTWPHIE